MGSFLAPFLQFFGWFFSPVIFVFHWVFYQPVYNVLMLIYEAIHVVPGSFALAIIILTLLIRGALIPLTRKQLKSSREMQVLQPRLKELQAQYRGDPQGMMAAQKELYKEHGVSMYGGCLPLLIQMPFLYALYYSFYTLIRAHTVADVNIDLYPFLPHLSALPSTLFLWTNLKTPDPLHILPVAAALMTFIQLRMAMPVRAPKAKNAAPDPTSQATSTMQLIMPVMTLFIGWTFPSGLALYWTISTGFSAAQQYFISGWGSLFLGVPGMERFVPAPKTPTPSENTYVGSVKRTAAGDSALAARRSAGVTTGTAGSAGTTGANGANVRTPGGFLQRMRENFASIQEAAAAQSQQRGQGAQALVDERDGAAGRVVDADTPATKTGSNGANGTNGTSGANATNSAARRPRSAKDGPLLVKPARPEQEIAREATSQVDGKAALPEVTIARQAGNSGGVRTTAASRPHPGAGASGSRSAQARRARNGSGNGRAKGGR
ncbi:MAG: YidC/Oxa1 family membrane protein insertase [Ktedonobacterales bacterium]